jgi:hypothetical protein
MIFDKLCGVVERHFPDFKKMMIKAKLFQFEGIPHHILPTLFEDKTEEEVNDICNGFFLPYEVTAIEDGASCIVIVDEAPDTIGVDRPRFYLEAMIPKNQNEYFDFKVSKPDFEFIEEMQRENVLIINYGVGRIKQWTKTQFGTTGKLYGALAANKKRIVLKDVLKRLDSEHIQKSCLQNYVAAVQEIMFFNQPDKFILERRHVKSKSVKYGRIARTNQRPMYTILHPAKIRKKLNITSAKRGHIEQGHDRRRHIRYLSHEIYSKDDNGAEIEPKVIPNGPRRGEFYYKKTVVPATWVGPHEAVVGNKRYKVILDR